MPNYQMWIGGKWVEAQSGKTYAVVNPATEEKIAEVPLGGKADVDQAVLAARNAFPLWSEKTQAERCQILNRIAAAIREHSREFNEIETLDHGTPISKSSFWTLESAQRFEYAAEISRTLMGAVIPSREKVFSFTQLEPIGVCALITPWNVPLLMIATKLAPALAMGNTCIVKPPSIDSLSALKLAEILDTLDLPAGTVNIITGPGGDVGDYLASHPGVQKVGFIGSCETGKSIMSSAGRTVKRVSLELGGKNPFIVLKDADIDAAVDGGIFSSFFNSGMICASPGRYYVDENVYDEFVRKMSQAASKIIVGDPFNAGTQMGPLVSAEHREKVESYIQSGINEGARLVLGGQRLSRKGYFLTPTIFADVTLNMKIAQEEIFGPVACILKFSSEEKVIQDANNTPFGLCASVWSRDLARALRIANEIQAGEVWINEHLILSPELPWGGFKESGIGKDNSIYALEEFSQRKAVYIDLSPEAVKPWHAL